MNYTLDESFELALLALCIWREARGQTVAAKNGVGWSIRNRVDRPSWWGTSFPTVILKPKQYSSFNSGDPNATKFPFNENENPSIWEACLICAEQAFRKVPPDPTNGSTHYFDRSLDANPPSWAASMTHVCDIDDLHFFR